MTCVCALICACGCVKLPFKLQICNTEKKAHALQTIAIAAAKKKSSEKMCQKYKKYKQKQSTSQKLTKVQEKRHERKGKSRITQEI